MHLRILACYALLNHTNACSLISLFKENFIILVHGSLALTITHPIVNLGPRRYHKITERVDNTVVPSNVAPGEFSLPYASCDELGPAEFLFSLRMSIPITHKLVSIFQPCKY